MKKKILTVVLAVIMLMTAAMPSMAMMYVDMPEKEQDPYNIDPKQVWLTQSDIEFILEAWRLTNKERAKVGTKPLTLDWQLCRLCKFRAIELTANYAHARANGDRNEWSVKPLFKIDSYKTSENIDYSPTINCQKAAMITVAQFLASTKGHKEALLGNCEYDSTHNIMGCCKKPVLLENGTRERTYDCFWFTTGYAGLDRYDPERNNMPKYSEKFKISVVELDRRAARTPLV